MKIGDEVFVHGYVDEIRKDCIIIRNNGGYFGTVPSEVFCYEEDRNGYGTLNEADTPQKKDEIVLDPSFAELSDEQFVKAMKLIEPQTDCGWK